MNKFLTVGISDMKIVRRENGLITYALGSCVGVCIYDPVIYLAGMIHIMLPNAPDVNQPDNKYKYANTGIPEMVRKMEVFGAVRSRLTAKIAGGARMFDIPGDRSLGSIGQRNVESVRSTLRSLQIPIIKEETGGNIARTVEFFPQNGSVKIRSYGLSDRIL